MSKHDWELHLHLLGQQQQQQQQQQHGLFPTEQRLLLLFQQQLILEGIDQGTLTEGDGSVLLTSLYELVHISNI
jgi:hypothetical protein